MLYRYVGHRTWLPQRAPETKDAEHGENLEIEFSRILHHVHFALNLMDVATTRATITESVPRDKRLIPLHVLNASTITMWDASP